MSRSLRIAVLGNPTARHLGIPHHDPEAATSLLLSELALRASGPLSRLLALSAQRPGSAGRPVARARRVAS